MGIHQWRWMPFRPPLLPVDEPTSINHRGWYNYIDFYINLLNLNKPFNNGLKKWMHKAAHHSDSVDSSNPRRWRGKRLHHHGSSVCWLFVLLWMDSWRHELIVCKKVDKNNLKMRLTALLFDPPRRAPHLMWVGGIKFTLVSPLLQVDIGGVGRTPLGRILYHQPTRSKTGTHHAKLIASLSGPHVWLPI